MTKEKLYIVWLLILVTACGKQISDDHTHHADPSSKEAIHLVSRPVNEVVLSAQKTIKPARESNKNLVNANGYIAFDERRNNKVSIRISGRIEKLHVKYNYQYVRKGQLIAEVYSPELRTYLEEYLFLLKSPVDDLAEKAEEKLRLLGLSESQIQQIRKTGIVTHTISIFSSGDGFIRFSSDPVSPEQLNSPSAMNSMTGVSSETSDPQIPSTMQIREGMYVNKGQTLFILNDCQKVWAILSVDILSQSRINKGDSVIITPEVLSERIKATVDLVEPVYQEKQRFSQVRVYLDNPTRALKINSLVKAEFLSRVTALIVPESSVFDLGTRKIVWVKTGVTPEGIGVFEPRVVTTGVTFKNVTEILEGLTGLEDIALYAGYLMDREGIVNAKP